MGKKNKLYKTNTTMNQISVAAIERGSTITRNNGNTNINIKSLAEPQVRDQLYRGILNLQELLRAVLCVQPGIHGMVWYGSTETSIPQVFKSLTFHLQKIG